MKTYENLWKPIKTYEPCILNRISGGASRSGKEGLIARELARVASSRFWEHVGTRGHFPAHPSPIASVRCLWRFRRSNVEKNSKSGVCRNPFAKSFPWICCRCFWAPSEDGRATLWDVFLCKTRGRACLSGTLFVFPFVQKPGTSSKNACNFLLSGSWVFVVSREEKSNRVV